MIKTCKIHGEYEAEVFEFPGKETKTLKSACPECYRIAEEKNAAIMKVKTDRENQKWRENAYKESEIEERHKSSTFDNYVGHDKELQQVKHYLYNFIKNKKVTSPLFLCGRFGTGKSHLGCAMINHLISAGICRAHYTTLRNMARKIRETRSFSVDRCESDVVEKYVNFPFLVLDEVGLQSGTDDEKMTIFDVMNGRYNRYHPTIIITKLPYRDLEKYLGSEVMDRFKGSDGELVTFDWESERGEHE